uniref:DNA mismatch repair protein Mlh1 isoform X2 n=1 Tax=Hirondellea gigas TaxID=1518452 RepID=A0A6A7G6Y7_9CRUS
MVFILFINERLVECSSIRKSVNSAFTNFLAKKTFPFIYLSISIDPRNVDVNVHPTKREVMFLHEESICETLQKAFEDRLASTSSSRTYLTQPKLMIQSNSPNPITKLSESVENTISSRTNLSERNMKSNSSSTNTVTLSLGDVAGNQPNSSSSSTPYRPNKLVRTDDRNPSGRLEAFLQHPDKGVLGDQTKSKKRSLQGSQSENNSSEQNDDNSSSKRAKYRSSKLLSVNSLIDEIDKESHSGLCELFSHHTFVGLINENFAVVQHKTKLYLFNVPQISERFMFEQILRKFGEHFRARLAEPANISDLVILALENPNSGFSSEDGDKEEIAKFISELLISKADLLNEYFAIEIDENGLLLSLPELCPNYIPPLAWLPNFILHLGRDVDWDDEQRCFQSLAKELSLLYKVLPGWYLSDDASSENESKDSIVAADDKSSKKEKKPSLQWIIQNILFPKFRNNLEFSPPRLFANNGAVVEIAALENLYKIFERC